jgi:hypothetical protein
MPVVDNPILPAKWVAMGGMTIRFFNPDFRVESERAEKGLNEVAMECSPVERSKKT